MYLLYYIIGTLNEFLVIGGTKDHMIKKFLL